MAGPSPQAVQAARRVFERHDGVMRTSDALAAGIHRRTLYWMRDTGQLECLSRGVYHLASHELPARPDVAAVMRRAPRAVLCLISALDLHEIGTQIPAEVQIALPRDVRPPRIGYPRVRAFHMSSQSLAAGVEEWSEAGVSLRVFSVAVRPLLIASATAPASGRTARGSAGGHPRAARSWKSWTTRGSIASRTSFAHTEALL